MFPPCAEPPHRIEHSYHFCPVRPFYYGMLHFPARATNNPRKGSAATPPPSLDLGLAKPQLKQPSDMGPAGHRPPTCVELFLKGPTPLKGTKSPPWRQPKAPQKHWETLHSVKGRCRRSSHRGPTLAWQRQAQKRSFGTQVAASAQRVASRSGERAPPPGLSTGTDASPTVGLLLSPSSSLAALPKTHPKVILGHVALLAVERGPPPVQLLLAIPAQHAEALVVAFSIRVALLDGQAPVAEGGGKDGGPVLHQRDADGSVVARSCAVQGAVAVWRIDVGANIDQEVHNAVVGPADGVVQGGDALVVRLAG
ncbi:hypothetical protein E2320_000877, partial [Naja naja]